MMRSIPIQLWPVETNTPRIRMLAVFSKSRTSSKIIAGSLPPSSATTGVKLLLAEAQTAWATGREPTKVIWLMEGWEVRWEAVAGQQTRGWIKFGECPQAARAVRAMEAVYERDQAVCSEALRTSAEPVNRVEMIGFIRL